MTIVETNAQGAIRGTPPLIWW